jgi:decaprenyl-phosphate phosphoribosyltransferase
VAAAPELVPLPRRRSPARAVLVALRPRQWSKNLLVFAGLVFAAKLGDPWRWLDACVCFVAYCAISSASYLANDVRDREDDRLHPIKRSRPIARGELSPRAALTIAGVLALLALLLVAPFGSRP